MGKEYYGIAIRMTDKRNSFLTAEDELGILKETIEEKGKAFYASELPVNAGKINQIRFVIFFDAVRKLYYLGEVEKMDYRKVPFRPMNVVEYGDDEMLPRKTWILLSSLSKLDKECLDYVFVVGGKPQKNNTLANKIKEPRFPRVYIYISREPEEYDIEKAATVFLITVGERFVKKVFGATLVKKKISSTTGYSIYRYVRKT